MQLKRGNSFWYECALKRVDVAQCRGFTQSATRLVSSALLLRMLLPNWADNMEDENCTIVSGIKKKYQHHILNTKFILQFWTFECLIRDVLSSTVAQVVEPRQPLTIHRPPYHR
jgi:hypothetical protein